MLNHLDELLEESAEKIKENEIKMMNRKFEFLQAHNK
jgi:hypothetical protein